MLKQIDDKGGLIKGLNNQIDDKGDLMMDLNNQIDDKENMILDLNNQIETMKSEYLNSLNSEEQALNQYLEEREKNTEKDAEILRLERRIQSIEKKYAALKNSKLGKVTLKYWEKKRKFSKRT